MGEVEKASENAPSPNCGGVSATGAERNWPLNCWWAVAHAAEISNHPEQRWISGEPIVVYRIANGSVAALHNRCPHRWAPLSKGVVQDDNLACAYHGFQFASTGQCVKVPTQAKVPSAFRVRSYPVAERYGFIWVWTGDPERADENLIPRELAFLDNPEWHVVWGYIAMGCNFMQIKENVLDLTHFNFLHAKSLGVSGWDSAPEVEVSENTVTFRKQHRKPLEPVYALPAGKPIGKMVDVNHWGTHLGPSAHYGSVDCHDSDPEPGTPKDFSLRVIHLTTPVSVGRSHYYWIMARNFGGPFDVQRTREAVGVVFREDADILEATQGMACRSASQGVAVETSVVADAAAVQARRKVAAQVDAERGAEAKRDSAKRVR